ncbi:MAG: site-2 protease family protein [Clostridiales bacterium]|nr:site-2 protease family protein [Clostridiales bacterium]
MLLQLLTHPQLLSDSQYLLSLLVEICYFIPAMIIALTLHECAHAYVAFRCGDPTAKMLGRMSLNPGAHLDLRGSLCLLLFGFGWAKPVPVNPRNYKSFKRDEFFVSFAGIAANLLQFLLATVLGIVCVRLMIPKEIMNQIPPEIGSRFFFGFDQLGYRILNADRPGDYFAFSFSYPWLQYVYRFLSVYAELNMTLALFNLLPIPPLDGYHILNDIIGGRLRIPHKVMQALLPILIVLNFATGWIGTYIQTCSVWVQRGVLSVLLPLCGL